MGLTGLCCRPPFAGVAGKTLGDSQPDWGLIGHVKPPAGAPNVLLVLIDDAGFGNPGTFGGPIDTPNYDRMAAQGLRYNRFHVTAMCSPTRAALLTGRKGLEIGGGVGLVVGLLAPPLLASAVVGGAAGALVGKFARRRVESGLEEKMGAALPPGSAGIVDRGNASTVDATLASAVKKSVAHVDGRGAKKLKGALAEAQAGMGG